MTTPDPEEPGYRALRDYVRSGKLLHLSTVDEAGPVMCSVWYAASQDIRKIVYTSRVSRVHSENVRARGAVAASIVSIELIGLGQTVTGAYLRGTATEATDDGSIHDAYSLYASRWPQVGNSFSERDLTTAATMMRMYVIEVTEYVWFDERVPGDPRHVVMASALP